MKRTGLVAIIALVIAANLVLFQNCDTGFKAATHIGDAASSGIPDGTNGNPLPGGGGVTLPPGGGGVTIPPGPPPIVLPTIAAGFNHGCAIVTGGVLKCWGGSGYQMFEAGRTILGTAAVPQILLTPGITDIALGSYDSECHILNGAVICTQGNWYDSAVPFSTQTPIAAGATKVAVNIRSACAVVGTEILCWGMYPAGTPFFTLNPTVRVTGVTAVTSLSVGGDHACAVDNGAVKCWAVLGRTVAVTKIAAGATKVSVSRSGGVCAVVANNLHCWSHMALRPDPDPYLTFGGYRLPDGTFALNPDPVMVMQNVTDVSMVKDYSQRTACAVRADSSLVCWGDMTPNTSATTVTAGPMRIVVATGVAKVEAMNTFTFTLTMTNGSVKWLSLHGGTIDNLNPILRDINL